MKNMFRVALLASALVLASCGGDGEEKAAPADNGGTAAEENAAPAAAPAANGAASAEGGGAQAGAQQDFTIVNNTGRTVMTLNVSASDSNEWGPDILGTETIANGASGTVQFARGQEQCLWDLRATFDDGQTGDWRGVNLCETATVTLTPS
jgi:hypothetical protein